MVLCPPFKWVSRRRYKLASPAPAPPPEARRETIHILKEDVVDSLNATETNGFIKRNEEEKATSRPYVIIEYPSDSDNEGKSHLTVEATSSKKSSKASLRLAEDDSSRRSSADKRVSDAEEPRAQRKRGVIAPPPPPTDPVSSLADLQYPKYEKDDQATEQIKQALMDNDFLKNLMNEERLKGVVAAMGPQQLGALSTIIREGESGSHLYVSAEGQFEVLKGGQVVKTFGPGIAFGELAILYKAKRFATIRCVTDAKVWTLERKTFQKIMVDGGRQEQEDNVRFLASVPLLQGIHHIELAKISDFLKREFFSAGTAVVRQGDRGDKFYIIRGGTVAVSRRDGAAAGAAGGAGAGAGAERRVGTLRRGDYFGEQALLHEDRRLATVTALPPGVECLTLERGLFTELLGNLEELRNIRHAPARPSQHAPRPAPQPTSEYAHIELKDLEILGTMGVGGFGRVELVQYTRQRSLTFALKCLKRVDMVQHQQQEHAFNEKNIMLLCNSPFICRLFRTYKDNKYLYFLMEPVLGGDVWTLLQRLRFFPEPAARFTVGCVVEAFHYLHERGIVYRDLKPENLMFDDRGYIKLVDFGFAKQLVADAKTWTFAGTPEYVAPEIVLNKGHDRAADCWTLGIFIHEVLVGKPPFRATGGDQMKTFTLILRGIDAVAFHPRVSKPAQALVRKLCRAAPHERLGYLKNGMQDIKNHKWFAGFDWEGLRARRLKPPLVQPVAGPTDLTNFERYPKDRLPPDETSSCFEDF